MSTCVFTFGVEVPMKSCHEDTLSSLYFDMKTGIYTCLEHIYNAAGKFIEKAQCIAVLK